MMITPDTIRNTLGIAGNITSLLLFASPIPTIIRIMKNKSVEEFKFHPYVAGIMNCIMWVFYSMPFIHPHNILVTTVNSTGFFLYISYVIIYFLYTDNRNRKSVSLCLLGETVFLLGLACVTLLVFETHAARARFVGIFCDLFGIILYGSPLTVIWMVVKTRSVEFMPLALSLTGFVNGIVWVAYALIRFDPFILTNDGIGAILGAVQLVLYACYYSSTPKTEKGALSTHLLSESVA